MAFIMRVPPDLAGGTCSDDGVTPCVSSVSGSVAHGSIVTLTGVNLIKEDLTNAASFFTDATWGAKRRQFEGTDGVGLEPATGTDSPFNVGWDTPTGAPGANEDLEGGHGFIDTAVKLRGSSSAKFHSIEGSAINNCGNGTGTSYGTVNNLGSLGSPQECCGRLYFRFAPGNIYYPNCYSKFVYNNTDFYIDFNGNSGSVFKQWILAHRAVSGGLTVNYYVNVFSDGSPLVEGRWYCLEWHWRGANSGTDDGAFELWLNGQLLYSKDGSGMASLGDMSILLIGTINANNVLAGTSWDFITHKGEVLVKTGNNRVYPLCTVELSNSPTYGVGTMVWQHAVALTSDASVQVELDTTGLSASPLFLHVRNHAQTQSALGRQVA